MDFPSILWIVIQLMEPIMGTTFDETYWQSSTLLGNYLAVTSVVERSPTATSFICALLCKAIIENCGMFYSWEQRRCICSKTLHRPLETLVHAQGFMYYEQELCEIDGYRRLTESLCVKHYEKQLSNMKTDSQAYCRTEGGRLVRVDTYDKYIALSNHLINNSATQRVYYIDGTRNQNNEWVMSDGSIIPPSAIVWAPNEPHTDECLSLYSEVYKHGDTWCSSPGPYNVGGFICERLV